MVFSVIGQFPSNFVGSCTASTGGGCAVGDQFDGRAVEVRGIETMGLIDVGDLADLPISVPVRFAWTWTDTEYRQVEEAAAESRIIDDELWK